MEEKKLVIKSEEKRLVYGEVYAPLQIDTDGESMSAEEIEKMVKTARTSALIEREEDSLSILDILGAIRFLFKEPKIEKVVVGQKTKEIGRFFTLADTF